MNKIHNSKSRERKFHARISVVFLLLPIIAFGLIIAATIFYFVNQDNVTMANKIAAANVITANNAADTLKDKAPKIERQFAYYQVQSNETVEEIAARYSIDIQALVKFNPGPIVPNSTIKIPPISAPISETPSSDAATIAQLVVTEEEGNVIRVEGNRRLPLISVSLNDLLPILGPKGGLVRGSTGKDWRLQKTLVLDTNVRLNLTSSTVTSLMLSSAPNESICLCLDNAELLIKDIAITSFDPSVNGPDKDTTDQRSFIRARLSSRMDIINSDISYLGNTLAVAKAAAPTKKLLSQGGTYGIAWRIPDDAIGRHVVTGWVEGNKFHHNYFGSYTFGASGMVWRKNHYYQNDQYGLDPHDDSNNALVEENLFENNGNHGFIMSKRCNYNVIRNNVSRNNRLHGYMLHASSNFNLVENNLAEGNTDNIAIYQSNNNIIRDNILRNARDHGIRINRESEQNFITANVIESNSKGIIIYDGVRLTFISDNLIKTKGAAIDTKQSISDLVIARNTYGPGRFKLNDVNNLYETNNTKIPSKSRRGLFGLISVSNSTIANRD